MNIFRRLTLGKILMLLLAILASGSIYYIYRSRQRVRDAIAEQERLDRLPDTLRVVTISGATTYFNYKGESMGFQYDLLRLFVDSIRRPMLLYLARDLEQAQQMLEQSKVDLCITPMAETQSGKQRFRYAGYTGEEGMLLIQRRTTDSLYIHNVTELLGRKITVLAGSRYERRLKVLEEQLGGKIDIESIAGDTINSEDLMARVSVGEIDYTVASEEIARIARTYYPNLDIKTEIGFKQRLRWIAPLHRRGLATALDNWWSSLAPKQKESNIYKRYFEINKVESPLPDTEKWLGERSHISAHGISEFDHLFEAEAKRISWSSLLLTSIAYQESNFRPRVIGWSGARGLMGIMPRTGRIYGANKEQLLDPKVSVRVAVDCLRDIQKIFTTIPDPTQQKKLILAAYNAGPAHIQDAQRLAKKYGANPNIWDGNVEEYVRLKSDPKYYNDPVCKYGYLRGKETLNYVQEVMDRYHFYQTKVKH